MTEEKNTNVLPHNCILEDRRTLSVSGVKDVGSFDEETILIETDLGELTVKGEKLHITRLSLEVGEVGVEGKIASLSYTDVLPKNAGFFSKVFR